MTWHKLKYALPNDFTDKFWNCYVMKMDTNIHIIDWYWNTNFKVNIYNIIPREIIISHRTHFKPLIMGYVREKESDLSLQSIPLPLKMVILYYFQLF